MSLENLKQIIEFNKSQKTVDQEELDNGLCPDCDWPLDVNKKGEKSCPICGRIWR